MLLFATYSPPSSTGTDRCASGVTHLFVLDATNGAARQSKRYVELRNLKISGIEVDRTGRVYIGFVDYKGTAKKEFSRAGLTSFSFPEAGSNQVLAVGNLFGPGGAGTFAGRQHLAGHQRAELGPVGMGPFGFIPIGNPGRALDVGRQKDFHRLLPLPP